MNLVEIFHAQPMEWVRITIDDRVVVEHENVTTATGTVDQLPAQIRAEFRPFGLRPQVRYCGFLLDPWLANIQVYDHQLEFTVGDDFYRDYRDKDIQGRMAHVSGDPANTENLHDKYIGINNLYPELVAEIRDLLA